MTANTAFSLLVTSYVAGMLVSEWIVRRGRKN